MKKYFKHKIDKAVSVPKIVTIHYFELTKDFDYPSESHDFCELHYVDKGHVICYYGENRHELYQGDMLFYKPMVEHRLVADQNTSSNVCVISFECNSSVHQEIEDKVFKLSTEEKYLISTIYEEASKYFELTKLNPALKKMRVKNTSTFGSSQLIQNSLEHLLINLLRKQKDENRKESGAVKTDYDDKTVNDIIEFMNKNLNSNLSLFELSRAIGYGTTFLCSRFKSVTGKSILRFFTELKIEHAKKMIRENKNITVSEISDTLNFCEPAYFCSVFKKITGLSPKEYSRTIHAFDARK